MKFYSLKLLKATVGKLQLQSPKTQAHLVNSMLTISKDFQN